MKRGIVFTLIAAGVAVSALLQDADARRYYYRHSYRSYYDYDHSPIFGLTSPYERTRRPLNVPATRSASYRSPSVVYVYQQPMVYPPYGPAAPWFSQTAMRTSPYAYLGVPYPPYSNYPPVQPIIIERERIVAEQPRDGGEEDGSQTIARTPSYIPSKPIGEDGGFVKQLDYAQRLFRERNYQQAAEAYHKASGLSSDNALVKMGQALSLLAVGDYESAASALRRALMLNPEWCEKPILPATFYGELNDFNAHLFRLERFVEKNKEHVESQFLLAYLFTIADRLNEAADLLAGILERHPNDLEATTLLGRIAAAQQGIAN
ncbi:MAG: tetratricopeptide repeat protein [Candidatus Hinthialibacter sp.]